MCSLNPFPFLSFSGSHLSPILSILPLFHPCFPIFMSPFPIGSLCPLLMISSWAHLPWSSPLCASNPYTPQFSVFPFRNYLHVTFSCSFHVWLFPPPVFRWWSISVSCPDLSPALCNTCPTLSCLSWNVQESTCPWLHSLTVPEILPLAQYSLLCWIHITVHLSARVREFTATFESFHQSTQIRNRRVLLDSFLSFYLIQLGYIHNSVIFLCLLNPPLLFPSIETPCVQSFSSGLL